MVKAKQVRKEPEPKKNTAKTEHKVFEVGEPVRLESLGSDGSYEVGYIAERVRDHDGKMSYYRIALNDDPGKIVKVGVWFVKGMDSPERPK